MSETIKTIVVALLLALCFRTFAYEPYTVPTGSMKPSIEEGDHLFISKFSYGYSRYSFPFNIPIIEGRAFNKLPDRGDVSVFKIANDPKMTYVKRIVGLPGDEIQVIGGVLNINNKPVHLERVGEYKLQDGSEQVKIQYLETLPNGKKHMIIQDNVYDPKLNTGVYKVPDGHFFMMGDNRDNSLDSRFMNHMGFVPQENLIGRAEIFFFSLEPDFPAWQLWKWPSKIRYDRILKRVD